MFRPLTEPATARWRSLECGGIEHMTLETCDGGWQANAVVVGARGGRPYGASYWIEGDAGWQVRSFTIKTTDGRRLALLSHGDGNWQDEDGRERPEFDGCLDIDLAATPFTNTLPIRRSGLTQSHGRTAFAMLFVPFDTLDPHAETQFYTCLDNDRLYRFETADGSFAADLPVDADGLVTDYPDLFQRL